MKLNPGLLALSVGAFGIGVTEFAPMGLLPVIAGVAYFALPLQNHNATEAGARSAIVQDVVPARAEIVPVGSIDGHRYQPGPVARTLIGDFHALVRAPDAEGFGESAHFAEAPAKAA